MAYAPPPTGRDESGTTVDAANAARYRQRPDGTWELKPEFDPARTTGGRFVIPGAGGQPQEVSEQAFTTYWNNAFQNDPQMQKIFENARARGLSEQSAEYAAADRARQMGWTPPDNSWSVDFDKNRGFTTEGENFFTRHQTAITAAAAGGLVGASALGAFGGAGAAGTGGGGAAGAGGIPSTAINMGTFTGLGSGGAAGGGAGWTSLLQQYLTGQGGGTTAGKLITIGKLLTGLAEGRAKGRLDEESIMALDARLRMDAARLQVDLYNQARRDAVRGKLLQQPPIDYDAMLPDNVREFGGAPMPKDRSRNPELGKQLEEGAKPVLDRGLPTFSESSIPPPPYAGKGDTALNWIGTGLNLYGSLFGDGGGGSTSGGRAPDPYSGAASSPADFASDRARLSDVPTQSGLPPLTLPSIELPPYGQAPLPTDENIFDARQRRSASLDPFLPSSIYRVNRSGVRF